MCGLTQVYALQYDNAHQQKRIVREESYGIHQESRIMVRRHMFIGRFCGDKKFFGSAFESSTERR